ncbi:putative Glycosyltransferase [hydrothermal vent metagenome]|uniref:Putative Glycosyltransferase n=1 Tax=hydrothermal vent metagenome TaxID=652676 RepID=A0A1W1BNQ3_9ZZZZ
MKILIDPQGTLSLSRNRGIGRYTRELIKGIVRNKKEHQILIILNMLFPLQAKAFKKEFSSIIPEENFIPFYGVSPNNELNIENEWNKKTSELMLEHFVEHINPDFFLISSLFEGTGDNSVNSIKRYTKNVPTAVIFYDLIPLINPIKFLGDELTNRWYRRRIESLKRADLLLSISSSARDEALEYLDFDESRVINISTATDPSFIPTNGTDNVKEIYGITRPFLMHTSAYEERKNFEGLIEAFSFIQSEIRLQYQLVLVCGLRDNQRKTLQNLIDKSELGADEVILTGFVSDKDLIGLYRDSYLLVFPSHHEGFGLPVLEAMSCGTAVIGSNNSSIPEVINREDALFNPFSILDISEKIRKVMIDKEFHKELEKHSLIQAKEFSWDKTAIRAIEAIENFNQNNSVKKETLSTNSDLINAILEDTDSLGKSQENLAKTAIAIEKNEDVINFYNRDIDKKFKWRVEGPFDSSYSLALLNRETALALDKLGHSVALHSTEGGGDFEPNQNFLKVNLIIDKLHQNSFKMPQENVDVTSRNLYPPRVCDMNSPTNMLHHYAWEESGFPQEWVENYNNCLSSLTCLSTHIQKILIDNGVRTPMLTSGCGVDHWERVQEDRDYIIDAKSFKFLHVSSCFPRKGADILLKAYGDEFTSDDDVTLIIKTFENPHNEIDKWLEDIKKDRDNFPDVIIIKEDLTQEQLKSIYIQSDVLVGASRAEGFGLPFAEAMLSGLAVITTAWGGQLDFCNNDTAWLIDYEFTKAKTHFNISNSVWAEPSQLHLAQLMREVYALTPEERAIKSNRAREILLKEFSWEVVAQKLVDASLSLKLEYRDRVPSIGWITSWNNKCGIASYSEHLINSIDTDIDIFAHKVENTIEKDGDRVYRCWSAGDGNSLKDLERNIDQRDNEVLIIQFNYSFFDFNNFYKFLEKQIKDGRTIIIMMHSTTDAEITPHKKLEFLAPIFAKVDRILVHSISDLNRLKSYGLIDNVAIFPHGIVDWNSSIKKEQNKIFTLASYGFFLPHKGLLELIETISIIKKSIPIKLKMVNSAYPVPQSEELIKLAKSKIKELNLEENIELITDFLSDNDSLEHLNSSDLIIFPYQETGESSSASVRYGLASGKPVAVTPLGIFEDVEDASYKLSGTTPKIMAESIQKIIIEIENNTEKAKEHKEKRDIWKKEHLYSSLGKRLLSITRAL